MIRRTSGHVIYFALVQLSAKLFNEKVVTLVFELCVLCIRDQLVIKTLLPSLVSIKNIS